MPEHSAQPGIVQRIWRNSAFRYLLAGGSAFIVDAGMLALFREVLHWPVWVAAAVAFVLSFFFTYFAQKMFAFGSALPHGNALFRYLVLVVFNTAATAAIVAVVAMTPLGWFGGKILSTIACTIWNYFVYKNWVFPSPKAVAEQAESSEAQTFVYDELKPTDTLES